MVCGYGMGSGIGVAMMFFLLLVIIALVVFIVCGTGRGREPGVSGQRPLPPMPPATWGPATSAVDPAIEVARMRFAKGEITKEQFDDMAATLQK